MDIGDTFHFNVPGSHLWMVITHPFGPPGNFVMVNATTLRAAVVDDTCILNGGDHPEILHDSVIYYQDAREWWITGKGGYEETLAQGLIISEARLNVSILRRVQKGALASRYFKKKFSIRVNECLV